MTTIPNPQITPIPNNEPDATPNLWNTRYVEIDANFSNLDERTQAAELELSNSKGTYASLPAAISTIDNRVAQVEASISGADTFSIAKIKQATHLDWAYRNDRISFEFFTPDYTLIDKTPTAVTGAILGDDSLDVESTEGITAGSYYVLSDGTDTVMIRVKNVLSAQRLRLYDSLDKHWTNATVSKHNFIIDKTTSFATANVGAMWMSKLINIGNRNGKLVIRRSVNTAIVSVFYQSEEVATWTETPPIARTTQVIDGVPVGFIDVEYQIPVSENIRLRLEVSGETVVIQHIVAFGLQYLETLNQAIASLSTHQTHLEQKANVHHLASTLDWSYRFDRMRFEFFAPEYTLLNKSAISIREAAVQGDNTIDVGDTTQFIAGDYYALHDGTHTRLIKIAAIHTDNILTIEGILDRRWDASNTKVSKCNFDVLGGNNAVANDGEMWISKPITLSTDKLNGFVVIRRTYNTAAIKLWWMDADLVWTESIGVLRQIGSNENKDDVPVGFADYEFALPFAGEGKIRIEVIDAPQPVEGVLTPNTRPVTIQHIVAIGLSSTIVTVNNAIDLLSARQSFTELNTESLSTRLTVAELDISGVSLQLNSLPTISIEAQTALDLKANQATTYTKTETDSAIQAVIGVAPDALNTLAEIAAQLANDETAASALTVIISNKVDKVTGKALSTNDYTTVEKSKLTAIEAGAQVNPTLKTINGNVITGTGDIVISGGTGGTGGATSASDLTLTPVGNISATNVQAAIAELDTEKASVTDLDLKANASDLSSKANSADVYSKTEIDALVIGNLTISTIDGGTF